MITFSLWIGHIQVYQGDDNRELGFITESGFHLTQHIPHVTRAALLPSDLLKIAKKVAEFEEFGANPPACACEGTPYFPREIAGGKCQDLIHKELES